MDYRRLSYLMELWGKQLKYVAEYQELNRAGKCEVVNFLETTMEDVILEMAEGIVKKHQPKFVEITDEGVEELIQKICSGTLKKMPVVNFPNAKKFDKHVQDLSDLIAGFCTGTGIGGENLANPEKTKNEAKYLLWAIIFTAFNTLEKLNDEQVQS